jgi:catechol 2,3-dioxygenase-like lactoylglutathione lyase family enzyme
MFKESAAFSGFTVKDQAAAKAFYSETLGLDVQEDWMGLQFTFVNGHRVFIYQKDDHQPAVFTVLNFVVDDIDTAVDALTAEGITMERYDTMPSQPDEKGILRGRAANMGPDIAWFKDPAGNILSVLQN